MDKKISATFTLSQWRTIRGALVSEQSVISNARGFNPKLYGNKDLIKAQNDLADLTYEVTNVIGDFIKQENEARHVDQ